MTDVDRARALLAGNPVAVAYHADADGMGAAALLAGAIERSGGSVVPLTPAKGANVYEASFRAGAFASDTRALVLLDTGARAGISWRAKPTLIIDHHALEGIPDAELVLHDERAVSTTLLALDVASSLADVDDLGWLVAVGALGDAGERARELPVVAEAARRHGIGLLRDVVALVNATGRAGSPAPEVALAALRESAGPRDVAAGRHGRALAAMRAEVAAASARARKVAPRIRGAWAIIEIEESCRVHGVVASAWTRRLARNIVLVANRGYMPGRVHLSVRSHGDLDLRARLHALVPDAGPDFGAGHARATGAIIDVPTWHRLRAAIETEAAAAA